MQRSDAVAAVRRGSGGGVRVLPPPSLPPQSIRGLVHLRRYVRLRASVAALIYVQSVFCAN